MIRPQIRKVALALRLSFSSHRDILYGISRYAKSHHWQLLFTSAPDGHAHEQLTIHPHDDIDGLISCEDLESILPNHLYDTTYPIVLIGTHKHPHPHKVPLGIVKIDDKGIGSCGASFLMSLGKFRSFGFVGENHRDIKTDLRAQGFLSHLTNKAETVRTYLSQNCADGTEQDIRNLSQWLLDLPKPAAVMATYDLRATQVLEAAHKAQIDVPGQLAVIGVDNDELLCDFTSPTLTSIAPDFIQVGELAARTLNRLMQKRAGNRSLLISSTTKRVIERESTSHLKPSAALVERALSYIRKNALSGINVTDVVDYVGASRRLVDKRFKELTGTTVLETIIDIRLDEIKSRLASTQTPIGKITRACGFRSENHAKNLFKSRFGISMRDYRASRERS